jgi:hypothetical protein
MKEITGWVKCPICEGKGVVLVNSTEVAEAACVRKALAQPIPIFKPCGTCKDSEYAGCLPTYKESGQNE